MSMEGKSNSMTDNDPGDVRGRYFDSQFGGGPPESPIPGGPAAPDPKSDEDYEDMFLKATNPNAWRRKQWRSRNTPPKGELWCGNWQNRSKLQRIGQWATTGWRINASKVLFALIILIMFPALRTAALLTWAFKRVLMWKPKHR